MCSPGNIFSPFVKILLYFLDWDAFYSVRDNLGSSNIPICIQIDQCKYAKLSSILNDQSLNLLQRIGYIFALLVLSRSFNVKVIKLLFRRMEWANINFPNTLRWDITQARNISVSISRERTGRGLQPGKPRVRVTFGNCGHYWPRWRLHFLRNSAIIEKGSFVVESPYLLWNWFEKLFEVLFSGNYWIECYWW